MLFTEKGFENRKVKHLKSLSIVSNRNFEETENGNVVRFIEIPPTPTCAPPRAPLQASLTRYPYLTPNRNPLPLPLPQPLI